MRKEEVAIIGSGPAGLTAALYTGRANLKPLVISGNQLGGQISITWEVENYPGFPEGSTGPELVERMQKHAERFGAEILIDEVTEIAFGDGPPFMIKTYGEEIEAQAVIIASGASPKRLGVPGEEKFIGKGVSFCATCDGFFFREKDVIVVGGGDSAIEESLFLTRFANDIQVIHRRDELRANDRLKQRARENEKIHFVWDTVIEEIAGNGSVESVRLRNVKTDQAEKMDIDGVFIFIGHYPNSDLFKGQLALDERNYVQVDDNMMTSVRGVFAAGEIMDPKYRQISTSVGQATAAAMMCERWLEDPDTLG
ncbi:MAG TPA: thioredoxin-disulfide reductase [Anaerolineales bacterium]|jgi:thioredoxin reductase (NADPH)